VYKTPAPPVLSFGENSCICKPPVNLVSDRYASWSNGSLGNQAEVFTFSHVALARHSEQAPSALAFRNGLADLLAGGGVLWLPTLWRQLGDGTGRAERPLEVLLIRALSAGVAHFI